MDAARGTNTRPVTLRPVTLQPGEEAIARMPSPAERRRLNLDPGVPVIEIRRAGVVTEVLPAQEVRLHAA